MSNTAMAVPGGAALAVASGPSGSSGFAMSTRRAPSTSAVTAPAVPLSHGEPPHHRFSIKKMPIVLTFTFNAVASYWGAAGLMAGAESYFPKLAKLPILEHLFTTTATSNFDWAGVNERFWDTMEFGYAVALPVYAGMSMFRFLPTREQQEWAMRRIGPEATRLVTENWQRVADGADRFNDQLFGQWPTVATYTKAAVKEGVIGAIGLLRQRDSEEIGKLKRAQAFLGSRPLTRGLRRVMGAVSSATLRAKMALRGWRKSGELTDEETNAAIIESAERASYVVAMGGRLFGLVESPLGFISAVTPTERAKFSGLALDMTIGTAMSVAYALLFGAPLALKTFTQSAIINVLGSYANVIVNQHPPFQDQKEVVWGYRTAMGIVKGWMHRAVVATETVQSWFGNVLQLVTGGGLMAFANYVTEGSAGGNSPISRKQHQEALSTELRERHGLPQSS